MFCSPFPTVAEAVQEELEDYKTKEDEVRRLKRAMVINCFHCDFTCTYLLTKYMSPTKLICLPVVKYFLFLSSILTYLVLPYFC